MTTPSPQLTDAALGYRNLAIAILADGVRWLRRGKLAKRQLDAAEERRRCGEEPSAASERLVRRHRVWAVHCREARQFFTDPDSSLPIWTGILDLDPGWIRGRALKDLNAGRGRLPSQGPPRPRRLPSSWVE